MWLNIFDTFDDFIEMNCRTNAVSLSKPLLLNNSRIDENGNLVYEIDLPGVKPENLKIDTIDGCINISAERNGKTSQRKIVVPLEFDISSIVANLSHGVLALTLSRSKEHAPRQITVNVI